MMARWAKWLVLGVGAMILILVALYVGLLFSFTANSKPSNIADFEPTSFQAKADAKFFYSIGSDLKYSDQIDREAPTLLRGQIKNFLVSPDTKKIAVVANGQLVIVGMESLSRQVTSVDSIYREPKPVGQQFFRDDDFQWSRDSKVLYLIRDEYYKSQGSQLFSSKGELWKYDIESASLQLVLKPFPAYSYFFGLGSGIYFSVPTDRGDLILRYFDGEHVKDIGESNAWDIPHDKLALDSSDSPFYSFSIHDYAQRVLSSKGVDLALAGKDGPERLLINGKPYLALTQGQNIKGPYYCSDRLRSVFLPGDRYFLFNAPYCGNYEGQLLIDTFTAKYERLPAGSVVYATMNTDTYSGYRITGGGIVIN